jgi:hypothetical protein
MKTGGRAMGRVLVIGTVSVVLFGIFGSAGDSLAAAKKKKATSAPVASKTVNACGCYKDANGSCFCGRKGKCMCPGECEPKGCEEKRAKDIQKEIAAEEKKAAEADKKARRDETVRANRPEPDKEKAKPKAAEATP